MARVMLVGLTTSTANQIRRALSGERHEIETRQNCTDVKDLLRADIVFADGSQAACLPLLRGIRQERPSLPFVVVTMRLETSGWLDAIEAGATDYCAAPLETRQIAWAMESALRKPKALAA
ncbi:MAG: hypothetical protein ABJC09_17180 [Terriglobia bacterium]